MPGCRGHQSLLPVGMIANMPLLLLAHEKVEYQALLASVIRGFVRQYPPAENSECRYPLRGYVRISTKPGQDYYMFPGNRSRLHLRICERLEDEQAQARSCPNACWKASRAGSSSPSLNQLSPIEKSSCAGDPSLRSG